MTSTSGVPRPILLVRLLALLLGALAGMTQAWDEAHIRFLLVLGVAATFVFAVMLFALHCLGLPVRRTDSSLRWR